MTKYPKVFLGGLPSDVNETLLRHFFSKYGKASFLLPPSRPTHCSFQVVEVVIMYNQERKTSRGNGFRGKTSLTTLFCLTSIILLKTLLSNKQTVRLSAYSVAPSRNDLLFLLTTNCCR